MRWDKKPPIGTPINFSHPLGKGLIVSYLVNEGGGRWAFDLALKNQAVLTVGTWHLKGMNFPGSGLPGLDSTVTRFPTIGTGPYTMIYGVNPTSVSSVQSVGAFDTYAPAWIVDSGGALDIYHNGYKGASTSVLSVGKDYQIGFVRRSTGANDTYYYINGIQDATTITHGDNLGVPSIYRIGNDNFGNCLNGIILYNYMWNRALLRSEMEWIYAQPFDMFTPSKRYWVGISVAPPTGKMPKVLFQSRMM